MISRLLPHNDTHRKIIHLDMDSFYASVEHRDHPEFKHKAVVVGRDPRKNGGHGVVATADYYARSYGVHSAMPAIEAVKRIPASKLVFVEPDFTKYRGVSAQVHAFMHEVTERIEPVSLDEAYLDVTSNKLQEKSAALIGNYLQKKIYQRLHLTCSFGVSYNKFLAKMGSEYAKPFGKTVILPEEAELFLAKKDIAAFPGIGKKTQQELRKMGINTGFDLQGISPQELIKHFKKQGYIIAMHCRGIDLSLVKYQRQSKSLGKEQTFTPNIYSMKQVQQVLQQYSKKLAKELKQKGLTASCLVLKIRDNNFRTVSKRKKLERPTADAGELLTVGKQLFDNETDFLNRGIRLLGLTVTDLSKDKIEELNLFDI